MLSNKKLFFVLGFGRSGTKLLSKMLQEANLDAKIQHEPFFKDAQEQQNAFVVGEEAAQKYIHFERGEFIKAEASSVSTYGEVNSLLRRHAASLKTSFPHAKFVHLARNGKDVIRSLMSRRTMLSGDPNSSGIVPTDINPFPGEWDDADRFERLCWYWAKEMEYLSSNIDHVFRLEDGLKNYNYFYRRLSQYLGVDMPKDIWYKNVNNPVNQTGSYSFPHWRQWSKKQKEIFNKHCNDVMIYLGYYPIDKVSG
ncbi:MAG: sulfotransferase [Perlabentimonas sp.]